MQASHCKKYAREHFIEFIENYPCVQGSPWVAHALPPRALYLEAAHICTHGLQLAAAGGMKLNATQRCCLSGREHACMHNPWKK